MKLIDYIKEEDISVRKFARKAGITPPTVHSAIKGKDIRLSIAMKIERASKGKVTCQEMLSEKYLK